MRIKITIEVELEQELDVVSEDGKLWFENEVLIGNGSLLLHSNEVGDTIGTVKSVKNIQWIK